MNDVLKCAQCSKVGEAKLLTCGGCGSVKYCSKEHQRQHWKRHKGNCKPYKIAQTKEWGRYLVSSRALKPGDRILTGAPSVVGPPLESPAPICLGCDGNVPFGSRARCPGCGYAFCTEICLKERGNHSECQHLSRLGPNAYDAVLPLRFLIMSEERSETYERLLKLESHVDKIDVSERWHRVLGTVEKIAELNIWHRNEVLQSVGVIMTNSFEIRPGVLQGVYEIPSLMNHDCVGNTRLAMGEDEAITVFAATKIESGTPILFNYVSALDTTDTRLRHLSEFKFFTCTCARCQDPTELGTFNSAVTLDCGGCATRPTYALPKGNATWICSGCGDIASETARPALKKLEDIRAKFPTTKSERDLKRLYLSLKSIVHPNHGAISEVLQSLIRFVQGGVGGGYMRKLLAEKQHWCRRTISLLDKLDPGMSLSRGIILYEMNSATVQLHNMAFEAQEMSAKELLAALKNECRTMLRESSKIIHLEPSDSPLRSQFATISREESDLEGYIEMVENIA